MSIALWYSPINFFSFLAGILHTSCVCAEFWQGFCYPPIFVYAAVFTSPSFSSSVGDDPNGRACPVVHAYTFRGILRMHLFDDMTACSPRTIAKLLFYGPIFDPWNKGNFHSLILLLLLLLVFFLCSEKLGHPPILPLATL